MSKPVPSAHRKSASSRPIPGSKTGIRTLGLIAGWGDFPFLVARAAREQGRRVVAVGFRGETDPGLAQLVDEWYWSSLGQVGRVIRLLKNAGAVEAVLAGVVKHRRIYNLFRLDWRAVKLLAGLKDKRANAILGAVAETLAKEGIELISPLPWLKAHLPPRGCLTKRRPTLRERKDVRFGYRIARHVAGADIGQTVIVKNQAVVAVEAMEGTDACILRAGQLARGGAVVVKVAKPNQDFRFDVPVIGPLTVQNMKKAGVSALAFSANQTLFLHREKTLSDANRARLTLWGI
ncbi:MAG: UDP-2,3-diacylglucosamine diphosphatase LpxI [candidate division FCPU426 bacterium]